jgi:response regulator of citrate/malate metabolism
VSEAATVLEALQALALAPSWILLDLMLPDGNGTCVLHRVKEQRLSSRVCVITGCSADLWREAKRAGADHIFIKPMEVERLMAVLNE